jgi:hypoxanthine phosphoribosyltransferase
MARDIICGPDTPRKIYVSPQQAYDSSFELGHDVVVSDFIPNVMFAVMRGGGPTAIIANEMFERAGIENKFAATFTKSYTGTHTSEKIVKIGGYTLEPWNIYPGSKILIVEDTSDSGHTLSALVADILAQGKGIRREDIKIAVLDYKQLLYKEPEDKVHFRRLYSQGFAKDALNKFLRELGMKDMKHQVHTEPNQYQKPDFWVNRYIIPSKEDNPWISYPHEIKDLTIKEISAFMGEDRAKMIREIDERRKLK